MMEVIKLFQEKEKKRIKDKMVRFPTPEERAEYRFKGKKEACIERGYHKVKTEPIGEGPSLCEDCLSPVWSSKDYGGELPYRVEH